MVKLSSNSRMKALGVELKSPDHTLNPGVGVDNQENIFTVTGSVRIHALWLHVTTMTDTTVFDNVQFKIDSAGGSDDITAVNAAGAQAISKGCLLARTDVSGNALTVLNPGTSAIIADPIVGAADLLPFIALEQTAGVASTILFEYDADAATDLVVCAHCIWSPLSEDGQVVAV